MADYCTTTEVAQLLPQYSLGSWPLSATQVADLISHIDAKINVVLAARGLTVPFVSSGADVQDEFADFLTGTCAQGTAWLVARAIFPDVAGPGESPLWRTFKDLFEDSLAGLKNGSMIPKGIAGTADVATPTTINLEHPDDDVRDSLGTYARPAFHRRMSDLF